MDSQPDVSTGTLLGLDTGTTVEITNSYPIPLFVIFLLFYFSMMIFVLLLFFFFLSRGEKGDADDSEGGEDSLSETILRCYREGLLDIHWHIFNLTLLNSFICFPPL